MKYHAIIIIVDDNNSEITRIVKDENRQFDLPKTNMIVHDFYIGKLTIPEGQEMCQFIEELKGGAE
jgi:hypothetical protein